MGKAVERGAHGGTHHAPASAQRTPYRGINVLMLCGDAVAKGYASPLWMTFKQALELDAHLRKGEHGSTVVFADRFTRNGTNDQGEEIEQEIPFLKAYTVLNTAQIEGLPARFYAKPVIEGRPGGVRFTSAFPTKRGQISVGVDIFRRKKQQKLNADLRYQTLGRN